MAGEFRLAAKHLQGVVGCPQGEGNPFVQLRLGQSYLELNDRTRAAEQLALAYEGAGLEIFLDEDPRYYRFLRTARPELNLPADGEEDEGS